MGAETDGEWLWMVRNGDPSPTTLMLPHVILRVRAAGKQVHDEGRAEGSDGD